MPNTPRDVQPQPPEVGLPEMAAPPSASCAECDFDFADKYELLASTTFIVRAQARGYLAQRFQASCPHHSALPAPSTDLALIEEEQARHVSRQHCEQCERWCSTCGGSQKWPCRTHRLLALAREALAGREDTVRLDWMQQRSIPESGLTWLEIGPWTNDQTLRSYIDAARSAAGGK